MSTKLTANGIIFCMIMVANNVTRRGEDMAYILLLWTFAMQLYSETYFDILIRSGKFEWMNDERMIVVPTARSKSSARPNKQKYPKLELSNQNWTSKHFVRIWQNPKNMSIFLAGEEKTKTPHSTLDLQFRTARGSLSCLYEHTLQIKPKDE